MNDTCKICGLNIFDLPPHLRFISENGDPVCQHWFGVPAISPIPAYEVTIREPDELVVEWADGGEAWRAGNVSRLKWQRKSHATEAKAETGQA